MPLRLKVSQLNICLVSIAQKKVLKSVKNGWIKASKDTERTENIIIGLRPKTSDMAPKNSMAKASVKVADDKAKLAFVSLTLKDFVK